MKHFISPILVLSVSLTSMGWAQTHKSALAVSPKLAMHSPRFPGRARIPRLPGAESLRPPASATPNVIWVHCPPEAVGALCGYIRVALDRRHPGEQKIRIYFELYPHTGSGSAESAILANTGGPGGGTTTDRDLVLSLFTPNLDVHDLLLIDDRGRGLSGTIECEELQHGTAPFTQSVADCAAQLGGAASFYGTGDIAEDTEAVRAALGYDKLDYFGHSYGGVDIAAYATRFGEHLRSIVLDAPGGTLDLGTFAVHYSTHAMPRLVRLDCQRSPTCSVDHPSPVAELDKLIQAIRLQPVEGDAYDANGNLVHVRMDEAALLNFVLNNAGATGNFTITGEVLAAGAALSRGDPGPLLRLGAEGFFLSIDYGDPTLLSAGAAAATACGDLRPAWSWAAPVWERKAQYAEAVSKLPPNYFAPFSKVAAAGLPFNLFGRGCLWWEEPTPSSPVTPPHPKYPNVPTLALDGDMDTNAPLEDASKEVALFPGSTFVLVAEAGHGTFLYSQCAVDLESHFIETLEPGNTTCASTPETVFPAVGRFPVLAAAARPAGLDPHGHNEIGSEERKVVTVAVAAATDALQRSIIGSGDGVGLRAGTFHTDYGDDAWTTTLTDCAFATDVTVNGTLTWGADKSFAADLVVNGSGTAGGNLHVEGMWQAPGAVGDFKTSGHLGGREVAVLVPEA